MMETASRGSMRAALHYFVSFIIEKRRSSPDEFTFHRASAFLALPHIAAADMSQEIAWVSMSCCFHSVGH